jgi:hypothetical protein
MLVIKKGYTLTVTSWENDGDNYRTKTYTVGTLEEAEKLFKICSVLFKSCNNGEGGIGNSVDGEGEQTIIDFIEDNSGFFPDIVKPNEPNSEYWLARATDEISNIAYMLMGSSEDYDFRVCESVTCFYSPDEIHRDEIKFNDK